MTPQEKRRRTILERYGSFKAALGKRDVRDLILGGYNGGKAKTDKGFAKWKDEDLKQFTAKRPRDSKGRFIPKDQTPQGDTEDGGAEEQADR